MSLNSSKYFCFFSLIAINEKKQKYFEEFKDNLISGIEYYKEIVDDMKEESDIYKAKMVEELEKYYYKVNDISLPVYQEVTVKG